MSDDIDVGAISEALNDKLDRDAGNPATLGKERISNWGMPDYSAAVSISLPYTPTKNGYILRNLTSNAYIHLSIDGTSIKSYCGSSSNSDGSIIPIASGQTVSRDSSGGTWYIYFIPCKGG